MTGRLCFRKNYVCNILQAEDPTTFLSCFLHAVNANFQYRTCHSGKIRHVQVSNEVNTTGEQKQSTPESSVAISRGCCFPVQWNQQLQVTNKTAKKVHLIKCVKSDRWKWGKWLWWTWRRAEVCSSFSKAGPTALFPWSCVCSESGWWCVGVFPRGGSNPVGAKERK